MNKIYTLFSVLIFTQIAFGQINIGGKPHSFEPDVAAQLPKNTQTIEMPATDFNKIYAEDAADDRKSEKPWRFGVNIRTDISPKNAGTWTQLADGSRIWQLQIKSAGAQTLNIAFDNFKLPPGGVLYLYAPDKNMILGGFTERNNQPAHTFASELLRGDVMLLEYFEPKDADFEADLHIFNVTHGYRSLNYEKSFGDSGSCNMNAACADGEPWANEIRSVCMLVSGLNGFCTGALINNTAEDAKPYILTADHCYENPDYILFRFNWQSADCENPPMSPQYKSINGATSVALNASSDFCLFKMNEIPPSDYHVYYAGWDRSTRISQAATCIHHPSGDIKKISFDDDPLQSADYDPQPYLANSHWKIEAWERNTTTEAGSSGSPLFNDNHLIIGQLHGGWASCESLTADYFGKMSMSWDYNSTLAKQLKPWLDPLNTGVESLVGYDPLAARYNRDLRVVKVLSPEKKIGNKETFRVEISVSNQGFDVINSFTMQIKSDDITLGEIHFSGELLPYALTKISATFSEMPENGSHLLSFFVSEINGSFDENSANDSLRQTFTVQEQILIEDFEDSKLWALKGEFQIDTPIQEENFTAFSGSKILGTDLTGLGGTKGNYERNLTENQYSALSPVGDARRYENIWLSFKSRSAFESSETDKAKLALILPNDTVVIWENPESDFSENEWTSHLIDISGYATAKRFQLKFTLGETDNSNQFTGWNIDDVSVFGDKVDSPAPTKTELLLYPNPSDGTLYVELSEQPEVDGFMQITDMYGREVLQQIIEKTDFISPNNAGNLRISQLDLHAIPSGVYFISVMFNSLKISDKIVITKFR